MNKKAIQWLYRELPELVAKGILTQEASERVQRYYGEIKRASRTSVALIICGAIGALLIGLGIILLLAHNWEQLSRFTRALLSFAPLVIAQAFALWVVWKKPQSGALKEGTATFLSLMVGASIALISQTYHIPGEAGTFILTWMLLIVPLVYLMQASLPAAIYLIGITAWSGSHWDDPLKAVLFWPLAGVIIPHFIWALRQKMYTLRTAMLSLIMMLCVPCAASFSLGKTLHGSWIIIFSSAYGVFYSLGYLPLKQGTANWQRPLRIVGGIGIFFLALQFTFRYAWQYLDRGYYAMNKNISDISALPDHIITVAIIATALVLFYDNVKRKNLIPSLFGALPALAIVGYLLKEQTILLPLLIFNAYVLAVSTGCMMLGIRNNSISTVNVGMLMLAILIIARFFDSGINFIAKGLVFIIVGIGFLVSNVLLLRRKRGAE